MFRDRVVSMEQTQEIGEKNIELLTALVVEALPGFALGEHGLEHEQDLYVLTLVNADSGETRSVAFTRMVLSDAERLPAIVADGAAPIRARIVDLIRSQAGRRRIVVAMRELQTEDERVEADAIDSEWRAKHEAALAAKRAEDERRQRERQRQKQQEDARRQAQREREKRQRAAQGGAQGGGSHGAPHGNQAPAAQPGDGGGRRRRRRGRGGPSRGNAPGGSQQPSTQAPAQGPRPQQPQRPPQARPQPLQERPAGEAGGSRPEGGGRRRRRRGRGRGGAAGGGAPPTPSVL